MFTSIRDINALHEHTKRDTLYKFLTAYRQGSIVSANEVLTLEEINETTNAHTKQTMLEDLLASLKEKAIRHEVEKRNKAEQSHVEHQRQESASDSRNTAQQLRALL